MNNKVINLFVMGIVLLASAAVNAQVGVNDTQIRSVLTRIENKTDNFKRQIDSSMDRPRWNNTTRDENLQAFVTDFESATDRLKQRFDMNRAIESDVSDVLMRAAYIDRFMARNQLSRQAESQWMNLRYDLNSLARLYSVSWNWNQTLPVWSPWTAPMDNDVNTGGNRTGRRFDSRLTGTYRLNTALSDNVMNVVDRSINYYPSADRERFRRNLERRLASPEMIAIEKTGSAVTIASSNAPQLTFTADGRPQTERNARGRVITTTATADRQDGFVINYTGERSNDFHVSFVPTRDGQLRVTRRLYLENRSDQVTVSSVYDKIDDTAQWNNVFDGRNAGNFGNSGERFFIQNGTQIVATLRNPIDTNVSQVNDRVVWDVSLPERYRGAVIEGRISAVDRSGRLSGRANLSFDFDTIRMNGQTYRFAGIIDGVTSADGNRVSVNNEGTVRDRSQTTRTATRAGVGAALGALIGAIAGGGQGAAVGAAVGAGAGAGSVLIQGRDNIRLSEGTTFTITATSPGNLQAYR